MDNFRKLLLKQRIKGIIFITISLIIFVKIMFLLIYWFNHDYMSVMGALKEYYLVFIGIICCITYLNLEERLWRDKK